MTVCFWWCVLSFYKSALSVTLSCILKWLQTRTFCVRRGWGDCWRVMALFMFAVGFSFLEMHYLCKWQFCMCFFILMSVLYFISSFVYSAEHITPEGHSIKSKVKDKNTILFNPVFLFVVYFVAFFHAPVHNYCRSSRAE